MSQSVRHPTKGYLLGLSLRDKNAINRDRIARGLPALSSKELIDLQYLKVKLEPFAEVRPVVRELLISDQPSPQ
jgi:hypothetical protein